MDMPHFHTSIFSFGPRWLGATFFRGDRRLKDEFIRVISMAGGKRAKTTGYFGAQIWLPKTKFL